MSSETLPKPSAEPMLKLRAVRRHYKVTRGLGRHQLLRAVDGVDLEVVRGETLGLVGESGCGKSTLSRLIVGLDRPTEGEIHVGSTEVGQADRRTRRQLTKTVQIVLQDPYTSLNPRMTVGAIIGEPLVVHKLGDKQSIHRRVSEMLDLVGLSAKVSSRYPHEFSGGQLQRIGIARALAVNPSVLVCDEPVSALDVLVQAQILNLLALVRDELDLTCVFVAHDLDVVRQISDRVAVMYLGKIVEEGHVDTVLTTPQHPYTQALLRSVPTLDAAGRGLPTPTLIGDPPSPIQPPSGCSFQTRCPVAVDECRVRAPSLDLVDGRTHRVSCHLVTSTPRTHQQEGKE
ncbi:ABC transporter ATP-binding protein [Mycolicibacterium lutetiense]|jgi:oligopeptide transport system ATP-binding protein